MKKETNFEHFDCTTNEFDLHAQLRAFSKEGFELVSALTLNNGSPDNILLIFKRPAKEIQSSKPE